MLLRFRIGAYTPATIPMERLAEYMRDLAAMLGEPAAVHFVRLDDGSTNLVHEIEETAYPVVADRVSHIREGDAEVVYMNAYRALNRKLKEDRTYGELLVDAPAPGALLEFPGSRTPEPDVIEPVKQMGTIDGQLISIGGRDNTVPARVQDGDIVYRCNTTRAIARQLGGHIYGAQMRFNGVGTWTRNEEGLWVLKVFDIQSFAPLDETSLRAVVAELREISGDWSSAEDVWDELLELRDVGDETH